MVAQNRAALFDYRQRVHVLLVLGLYLEDLIKFHWIFFEPIEFGFIIMLVLVVVLLLDEVIIVKDF